MKLSTFLGWLLLIVVVLVVIGLADGAPGPLATAARLLVSQVGAGMRTAGTWLQETAS